MQGDETPDTDRDRWLREASFAATIFVAKLAQADAVAQTMSEPPTTRYKLTLAEVETLRGEPVEGEHRVSYAHTKGEPGEPVAGQRFLVLAERERNRRAQEAEVSPVLVLLLVPATDERLSTARKLAELPIGWTLTEDGKPVSPWAEAGVGWPEETAYNFGDAMDLPRDAKTGRPALIVPDGVELTVEQVIPEKVERFVNPYGNGRFRVTVSNTTDQPIEVPALLTVPPPPQVPVSPYHVGEIAWANSLLVIEDQNVHVLEGAEKPEPSVKPLTLHPGQRVSTVIDTLTLEGVDWPRGGSRVHFGFALGDRVVKSFFYYKSDFHDAVRLERAESSQRRR
ncbi:MAG: hypothetical protein ACOC1G_04765 [Phycisphaeraceae bacterium]